MPLNKERKTVINLPELVDGSAVLHSSLSYMFQSAYVYFSLSISILTTTPEVLLLADLLNQ